MAISSWFSNVDLLVRWLHVIAGVTWIGHLFFFNFVNLQLQPKLDAATKKLVNPQLLPRALFWFRWGAMITLLAGLVIFTLNYMYTPGKGFGPSVLFSVEGTLNERAIWILGGMTLGAIMWFNVWFVIWPRQKKIIGGIVSGNAAPPALAKQAALASKINTYLSAPMLFGMLGAPHYSSINAPTALVAVVLAEAVIFLAYRGSATAGSTV